MFNEVYGTACFEKLRGFAAPLAIVIPPLPVAAVVAPYDVC